MENQYSFDPIRPYDDHEVQSVIAELIQEENFLAALQFVLPGAGTEKLKQQLLSMRSIEDFQAGIIAPVLKNIIRASVRGEVQTIGIEQYSAGIPFLVISNHRDIVLDSAFLNYELFRHHFPTTRIAIGNNLLQRKWIEMLVRLNKNFIVHRDVAARQAYEYSARVSAYIRKSILKDKQSVWIAQREGRTKDGNDFTQPGLLKMLSMSAADGPDGFFELNILPLSITYEFEPCAGLKAREMYIRHTSGTYQKSPGEDLISMKTGMLQPKGAVNFNFGSPLSLHELHESFEGKSRNDALKSVAALIDRQIHSNTTLYANHYIAADLLQGQSKYPAYYSQKAFSNFQSYVTQELANWPEKEEIKPFLLQIYANPVFKKEQYL